MTAESFNPSSRRDVLGASLTRGTDSSPSSLGVWSMGYAWRQASERASETKRANEPGLVIWHRNIPPPLYRRSSPSGYPCGWSWALRGDGAEGSHVTVSWSGIGSKQCVISVVRTRGGIRVVSSPSPVSWIPPLPLTPPHPSHPWH